MAEIWLHGKLIDPDDPKLTLRQRAQLIAQEANECCNRSDGYEEALEELVFRHLEAAHEAGFNLSNGATDPSPG